MKENAINIENYHTHKEFKKVIDFNLLPLFFTKEIWLVKAPPITNHKSYQEYYA